MTAERFTPAPEPDVHCLKCSHHEFSGKTLLCMHPQRPDGPARVVVRWYAGCPQFKPKGS